MVLLLLRVRSVGKEVIAAVCGVGKVFASHLCEAMILTYHVDCVINIGVAGTLCDELGVMVLPLQAGLCSMT